MKLESVFLDTTPLGLLTIRPGKSEEADACRVWIDTLTDGGLRIYVPAIADYEVRRELERLGHSAALQRLDDFENAVRGRLIPITQEAMFQASKMWADVRRQGMQTAAPEALDGDVILAAQVRELWLPIGQFVVATSNVRHISRYVNAQIWHSIVP